MKNFAKLTLFFSLTFIIIFVTVTCLRFLSLWVDWAISLPPKPETTASLFASAAFWALTLTLFASILITLNYIVRRKHFPLTSIICVMALSMVFTFGISLVLNQANSASGNIQTGGAQNAALQLGEKGLILTNALNRNVTAVVILDGTSNLSGPRVIASPGQPLAYQGMSIGRAVTELPSLPFGDDTPWFLKSLSIDIRMNADIMRQMYAENFFSYLVYTGSLIFLLCALGFAIKFSVWPLANLFFVTLVFRGILAFVAFFYSPGIQEITASFLNNRLSIAMALPVLFFSFGLLVHFYSLLVFAAKRKRNDDD